MIEDPKDIFPARLGKPVNVKLVQGEGETIYKGDNNVVVGIEETVTHRTQRLQVAVRVQHSLASKKDFKDELYDQMLTHLRYTKVEGAVRREELLTALLDLKSVAKVRHVPEHTKAINLHKCLRALAIFEGGPPSSAAVKGKKLLWKILRTMDVLPRMPYKSNGEAEAAMKKVAEDTKGGKEYEARAGIKQMLMYVPPEVLRDAHAMERSGAGWAEGARVGKSRDAFGDMSLDNLLANHDDRLVNKEMRERIKAKARKGEIPDMYVEHLTYTRESKPTFQGPSEKLVTAGMKIRAKKLALAVSPVPPRMFMRKLRNLGGGSVLIDASGSMQITNDELRRIAESVPLGTVAYYSGGYHENNIAGKVTDGHRVVRIWGCEEWGHLVIWAEKGRRYVHNDSDKKLPFRGGNNIIDFHALQWLLRQPSPRYFVTDKEFTGCMAGYATELLQSSMKLGMVRVIGNIARLQSALDAGSPGE